MFFLRFMGACSGVFISGAISGDLLFRGIFCVFGWIVFSCFTMGNDLTRATSFDDVWYDCVSLYPFFCSFFGVKQDRCLETAGLGAFGLYNNGALYLPLFCVFSLVFNGRERCLGRRVNGGYTRWVLTISNVWGERVGCAGVGLSFFDGCSPLFGGFLVVSARPVGTWGVGRVAFFGFVRRFFVLQSLGILTEGLVRVGVLYEGAL